MFGEKKTESDRGNELPVWQTDKYKESKQKAIEIIESGKYGVSEGDFWILMRPNKSRSKMIYSGLIISHNGCLKINDTLSSRFNPDCVSVDKQGYADSLVFAYSSAEQGLYEVGEVSRANCQNDYPYAMAFKRLFDRVVLKLSKLAFAGIYSDSESEEFAPPDEPQAQSSPILTGKTAAWIAKIRKTGWSDEKLDKASMKKYGVPLCRLSEKQLKEVCDAIKVEAIPLPWEGADGTLAGNPD